MAPGGCREKMSEDRDEDVSHEEENVAQVGIEGGQQIPMTSLTPQQLVQLKQQLTVELQQLSNNMGTLSDAASRFQTSAECVEMLAKNPVGSKVLVPVSSSVYMDGVVTRPNDLLVDVGAKYFVEKDVPSTQRFLNEKRELVLQNCSQIERAMMQKQDVLKQCMAVLGPLEEQARRSQQGE